MRLQRLARTQQAIELLRRGMRTSLVGHISGLRPPVLRELHHEIHGRKPVAGQLPNTNGILRSARLQASASVFVALYRALGGTPVVRAVDVRALLEAHRLYLEQMSALATTETLGEPIDINAAWVIARDLTTGLAALRFCPQCAVHFLAADFSRSALQCPICALKRGRAWRRRRSASGPPAPMADDPKPPAKSPP
jgi:hypothetical protein